MKAALNQNLLFSHELYFERSRGISKTHPYLFWLILGLLAALTCITASAYTRHPVFLRTCLPLAAGSSMVPVAIRFGYKVAVKWLQNLRSFIDYPRSELERWYHSELLFLSNQKAITASALVGSLIALIAFGISGYFQGLNVPFRFLAEIMVTAGGFFSAAALHHLALWGRTIWHLGQFQVKVESHAFGILSTGDLLSKCWFIGAIIWCVFTLSSVLGSGPVSGPMLMLGVPAVCLVIGSFVICQFPLHKQMVMYKDSQLEQLDAILSQLRNKQWPEISKDEQEKLRFIEERIARVSGLPVWPFSWRSMIGVFASSLTAVLPTIAKAAIGSFSVLNILQSLI